MKYGPWKIGSACGKCNKPVDSDVGYGYLHSGSGKACCPWCGELKPEHEPWPQRRFRRVKTGWFGPWVWEAWTEPPVSGVSITFSVQVPPKLERD